MLVLAVVRLVVQYDVGIGNWDTFLYLENGRNFARMGWGDVSSIAPVLPVILSKLFLLAGHTYCEAIFNVDVFFYVLGVIVFYLLLRVKFNGNVSLVGSVVYATFTLLYSWAAIGGNDIIGVTGTLITVYLVVLACGYDSRFFYPAFVVAAYAFLSRYTAGVMLFGIIFYLAVSGLDLRKILDVVIGCVLGVVSVGWFLNQFYKTLGDPFPFFGQFSGTVSNVAVMDSGFLPDSWYYINHIPNYLSSTIPAGASFNAVVNPMGNIPTLLSGVYIVLMVLGLFLLFYNIYRCARKSGFRFTGWNVVLSFGIVFLVITGILTVSSISYVVTNLIFMTVMFVLFFMFKDYDIKLLDFDLMMVLLFITYVVFQSVVYTKNDRYFITALPFIAFFITDSLSVIYKFIDSRVVSRVKLSSVISVCIIIFLVSGSLSFAADIPRENPYNDIGDACDYFKKNYDYNNSTVIYSDNWPAVTWYLNIYTRRGVDDSPDGQPDKLAGMMLNQSDHHNAASFFFDTKETFNGNCTGFSEVKQFNTTRIYRNSYLSDHNQASGLLKTGGYERYYENLFKNM